MSDEGAQREMTLREWVSQLPKYHSARREFDRLVRRADYLESTDSRYVQVSKELIKELTLDWSDPVQLRLRAFNDHILTFEVRRVDKS